MLEGQASRTAERVATERAAHQLIDNPLVLVDPISIRLISSEQAARLRDHPQRHDVSPIAKPTRAIVVVRTRIAEDEIARAASAGVTQYVVLGAGLDTFAYRNPHPTVRVFEVDHPATQQLKLDRLTAAHIEIPERLTFVPFDFSRSALPESLRAADFDETRPAVFAWLGVVMYLERRDVLETLGFIASLPKGTTVIADYALPPGALPWLARMLYRTVLDRLASHGEPWQSFFEPGPLRADLTGLGFTEIEDLGADDINTRYLANRDDGLRSGPIGRIVIARR